jgi:hypothetical protein
MAEVGLTKKSQRNEDNKSESPVNGHSIPIYLNKIIVEEGRKWLETEDFSLETVLSYYLGAEIRQKQQEHRLGLQEAQRKEEQNTFSSEQYICRPPREKTFWEKLYNQPLNDYIKNFWNEYLFQ